MTSTQSSDRNAFAARPETIGNMADAAPMTGRSIWPPSTTGARSTSMASASARSRTHPAFRNTARMIARLYDALHDPARKDKLLLPTDTGNGRLDPRLLQGAQDARRSARRSRRDRRMGAHHLWLGRALAGLQGGVPRHARRQRRTSIDPYRKMRGAGTASARSACPSSTTPSSIRRSIATGRRMRSATSAAMSKRRPTTASSFRGAKVVATGSALTNYNFVAHHGPSRCRTRPIAVVFIDARPTRRA